MIVLIDKSGKNTKEFTSTEDSDKEAQKEVDSGDWLVDTDKTGMMKAKKEKKTTCIHNIIFKKVAR